VTILFYCAQHDDVQSVAPLSCLLCFFGLAEIWGAQDTSCTEAINGANCPGSASFADMPFAMHVSSVNVALSASIDCLPTINWRSVMESGLETL
jgi:hypothetical protein